MEKNICLKTPGSAYKQDNMVSQLRRPQAAYNHFYNWNKKTGVLSENSVFIIHASHNCASACDGSAGLALHILHSRSHYLKV
jgi:hypothetical protein